MYLTLNTRIIPVFDFVSCVFFLHLLSPRSASCDLLLVDDEIVDRVAAREFDNKFLGLLTDIRRYLAIEEDVPREVTTEGRGGRGVTRVRLVHWLWREYTLRIILTHLLLLFSFFLPPSVEGAYRDLDRLLSQSSIFTYWSAARE